MQEKDPKQLARLIFIIGMIIIAVLVVVVVWQLIVIQDLKSQLEIVPQVQVVKTTIPNIVRCLCL